MSKIITLGEIMLRLSTPGFERFGQADTFQACYGGGEANVAVSLANYGHEVEFVTKLPDNPIGACAEAELHRRNVKTNFTVKGGRRLGIYFLESGCAMRASQVVYDRMHSAFSEACAEEFDFEKAFQGADWFHFTGITPALSDHAAKITEAACRAAKKAGAVVSCDLNYRKKLWSPEKAQKVMSHLMQYVDICIGNEEDAKTVLGFSLKNTDITAGELELSEYQSMLRQMTEIYHFQYAVTSLRVSHSASDNGWSACIYGGENREFYHSKEYRIAPIADRVGGGDAFAAGLICGLTEGRNMRESLEFAVAASALKHTIPGDFNLATREEAESLMNGDASGRVQR